MATLLRPDGCELHWEAQGEGPLVVISHLHYSPPSLLAGLVDDLAADHRVLTYHLRGMGGSSRTGPYELITDAEDLAAVVETAGPPGIAVALGDGCNRAVRVAAERPDLISRVLVPGPAVFGAPPDRDWTDQGLASSRPVLMALVQLLETDYRAALWSMLQHGNPDLDEERVRERVDAIVDYCPREAAAARVRAWVADDAWAEAKAVGDRLWLFTHGRNPWFGEARPEEIRQLLPDAHWESLADGPFDRPDLTAAALRRISSVEAG
jgi:pimeloyl-ACP methyl ester carboxylesterase